ncbi:hypothetical protein BD779DRAFT_1685402 [Infundibulicybe gibba]|nr:hypothetical protein BD779DRAFT_1685402 [Infundibulicybe gibba]
MPYALQHQPHPQMGHRHQHRLPPSQSRETEVDLRRGTKVPPPLNQWNGLPTPPQCQRRGNSLPTCPQRHTTSRLKKLVVTHSWMVPSFTPFPKQRTAVISCFQSRCTAESHRALRNGVLALIPAARTVRSSSPQGTEEVYFDKIQSLYDIYQPYVAPLITTVTDDVLILSPSSGASPHLPTACLALPSSIPVYQTNQRPPRQNYATSDIAIIDPELIGAGSHRFEAHPAHALLSGLRIANAIISISLEAQNLNETINNRFGTTAILSTTALIWAITPKLGRRESEYDT